MVAIDTIHLMGKNFKISDWKKFDKFSERIERWNTFEYEKNVKFHPSIKLPHNIRLFITETPLKRIQYLHVVFEVGKVINDNNFAPLSFHEILESIKQVIDMLKSKMDIDCNLFDFDVRRVDLFVNMESSLPIIEFYKLYNEKLKVKNSVGYNAKSGDLYSNSKYSINIYDKEEQMKKTKNKLMVSNKDSYMIRIEYRFHNKKYLQNKLGSCNLQNILNKYNEFLELFIDCVNNDLFSIPEGYFSPEVIRQKTIMDIITSGKSKLNDVYNFLLSDYLLETYNGDWKKFLSEFNLRTEHIKSDRKIQNIKRQLKIKFHESHLKNSIADNCKFKENYELFKALFNQSANSGYPYKKAG